MGSWSAALFGNDTACDIRDHYRELIEDGVDDDEATRRTLDKFARTLDDEDDGPLAIVALAVTQSKLGRLDAEVARRALAALDVGTDLARWAEENPRRLPKRRAALEAAREQVCGLQPRRKKLRPPKRTLCGLTAGDILAFRHGGRCTLFRVVDVRAHRLGDEPTLEELDWDGGDPPSRAQLETLAARPTRVTFGRMRRFQARSSQGIDWRAAGFAIVGHIPPRPNDDSRSAMSADVAWSLMAGRLRSM